MRDVTPASKLAGDPDDAHEWGRRDGFECGPSADFALPHKMRGLK
jgi:hypothetical protein